MTPAPHAYSAYKPSDVLWLGNVPVHWELPRLKGYVTNAIDLTGAPLDGELYLALEHVEGWTGRCSDAGDGVSTNSQVERLQAQDVLFGKLHPYPAKVTCPKRNGVCVGESGRTHPVGARLKPDIARGVGAGLKPASTTTPHTADDRLHLRENATIHTTRGAGNGVSISSQVERLQAQDVLLGKLRPYLAKVTCPKRNGVCVGESGRTHPVGAGSRPDFAHPVGAGLKPAPTTTPHTADDRLHLRENATNHITRGATNRQ